MDAFVKAVIPKRMQTPEQICFYPHFSLVSDHDANLFCDKLL